MRRSEYESTRIPTTVEQKFRSLAVALNSELQGDNVEIEFYEDGLYFFRLVRQSRILIDGLNPAYANSGDYRRVILALEAACPAPRLNQVT